jgi:hypothetical protein
MSPRQGWSQCLAAVGALLFSQCNVAWRSFPQARGSGCRSFDSPWCFISTKCGSRVSARFLNHGGHTVCFCAFVPILDPHYSGLTWYFQKVVNNVKIFYVNILPKTQKTQWYEEYGLDYDTIHNMKSIAK